MKLDLRRDFADVYAHVADCVRRFDPASHSGPGDAGPVQTIQLGFDCSEAGWVAVVFDTRPEAELDGEWCSHVDGNELQRPHWLEAGEANLDGPIQVVHLDGGESVLPEGSNLAEPLGEMLKAVLLKAREDGVFAGLPRAAGCGLGVEHNEWAYCWPEDEAGGGDHLASVEEQRSYLETILARLEAEGFTITHDVTAGWKPEYRYLNRDYLFVAKRLVPWVMMTGNVEEVVLVGSQAQVDVDVMRLFAGRALTDALAGRPSFGDVLPVVYSHVYAVLIAGEVTPDLAGHFSAHAPPRNARSLILPVVYDERTRKIDYYREWALLGNVHVDACHRLVEELLTPRVNRGRKG